MIMTDRSALRMANIGIILYGIHTAIGRKEHRILSPQEGILPRETCRKIGVKRGVYMQGGNGQERRQAHYASKDS